MNTKENEKIVTVSPKNSPIIIRRIAQSKFISSKFITNIEDIKDVPKLKSETEIDIKKIKRTKISLKELDEVAEEFKQYSKKPD